VPAIRIVSGRHPFEVTSLATAVLCGSLLIGFDSRPRSVAVAMPDVLEQIWAFGLIVVGVFGLCGIGWRGRVATGLGVELGAMVSFGAVTGMYAIAVFVVSGVGGVAAGCFIAAVAVASWWRCFQIARDLGRLARVGGNEGGDIVQVPLLVERDPR
jgi:hypothetical protein